MLNARNKSSTPSAPIEKPKFSREQTFEYFKALKGEENNLFIEAIKNGVIDRLKQSQDASASDQFMAVQQARSFDKLKLESGVDESDYNDAMAYYKVDSEPQAIRLLQENFLKLQAARESTRLS